LTAQFDELGIELRAGGHLQYAICDSVACLLVMYARHLDRVKRIGDR
jgi:hypothetical protein